ncbi:MAG TPA: dihydrofolate reductase family protein [Actinomycetes bacterium]|nr:dihydrofolate reductase family protein [Actinomycetes bacterium]
MSQIVLYIAASLDGYIAGEDDDISWLKPFEGVDYGYDEFLDSIGAVIVGRRTYDLTTGAGWGWPYPVPGYVLTSRPPADHPQGADITFTDRPLPELVAEARQRIADDKDVWVVGGAGVVRDFLAAGLIDQIRLFVIPVMLGHGVRLFQPVDRPTTVSLQRVNQLPEGMVELAYAVLR